MALMKSFFSGRLETLIFQSEREMGLAAAADAGRRIKRVIDKKGVCNIIFAAAVSQDELLLALTENRSIDWSRVNAFHMDEYIGLPRGDKKTLGRFFDRYKKFHPGNFYLLDSSAADPLEECGRYAALLRRMPADIVLCGIGDNGHLAFNEPHAADFEDAAWVKTVEIDGISRRQQVNAGNFASVEEVPSRAFTLTIPALMAGEWVYCAAPTGYKAAAVKAAVRGEISEGCPASVLRRHPRAVLYLDAQSGGGLL